MSAPDKPTPPDFDDDYLQAIAEWRKKNKVADDDTILLLMDLFRIHQIHWDAMRDRQMPSLDEFRTDIAVLVEATTLLKDQSIERSPRG